VETAARELDTTSRRTGDVQRRAFEAGVPAALQALGDVSMLVAEAERSLAPARGGDADAAQKLHRLLLDAATALDRAEEILGWPDLDAEARRCALFYTPLVATWGTPAEQQLYDQTLAAAADAQKQRNARELEQHLEAMRAIGRASYARDPRSALSEIEWAALHVTQALDVPRATLLVERARVAHAAGDRLILKALVTELWSLYPSLPEQQKKSFGSGVR
jgi:hypothetical protein